MNIEEAELSKRSGSAILVTLLLSFVITLMVAGAMRLVSHEMAFSVHSSNWAQCLHSAEGGIEIALAGLQQTIDTEYAWSSCGWTGSATAWTKATSDLAPTGHAYPDSDYTVTLDASDPDAYTVTATASMPEPRTGSSMTRTVKVTLAPDWFQKFEKGMLGKGNINILGNPSIDSYTTELGPYGGGNVNTNCPVGSMLDGPGGITGGGSASLGGDVFVAENGSYPGTPFWTGTATNTLDVDIPDYIPKNTHLTTTPIVGGDVITIPTDATVVANDPDVSLYLGAASMTGSGGSKEVTIQGEGEVKIYVRDGIEFNTPETLTLAPTVGKTLRVHLITAGANNNIKGDLNTSGNPIDLQIYGTPNCTYFQCNANNDRALTIYAPQAHLDLLGNAAIFGSVVANTIKAQGTFGFHFDESLATNAAPIMSGWDISNWEEL